MLIAPKSPSQRVECSRGRHPAWHNLYMATNEHPPTSVQVMAARLRVKADKRLKRETPADIRAIANEVPATKTA